MGFGWLPVHGPESYKDAAFPWVVELSTRIREARMVISEVTARIEPATDRTEPFTSRTRSEPTASDFKDSYKDYLAGVRTLSELEKRGFGPYSHFALPVLAIQSGGLVVDELSEISRSIEHCVEDARVFYTLSFAPPYAAQPDEYHDLTVQIDASGLSARTTTGYYDQPVFDDKARKRQRNGANPIETYRGSGPEWKTTPLRGRISAHSAHFLAISRAGELAPSNLKLYERDLRLSRFTGLEHEQARIVLVVIDNTVQGAGRMCLRLEAEERLARVAIEHEVTK